jgi:GT2 family glycosyltransferase
MGPEPTAPAVVVVVVACDPGAWLEEALSTLAAQDYTNFSVLVMDVGGGEALAARVAQVLPGARVWPAAAGTSFGDAANQALEMAGNAAHVLVCHDDVALAPDALRLLVEEAYRSNAGLTCPKLVLWDAPERLLSLGLGADRLGVTHALVEPGELDQGQHDAAREVFVAPSAALLVRSDLWRALGGYEKALGTPGEDLDLSWRAHLAGARVVVAPQARARHLEAGGRGLRDRPRRGPEWEARREANRLRTLWTCYSAWLLVLVLPLSLGFALVEAVWGLGHHKKLAQAALPLRAVKGSLREPRLLWRARRSAQGQRRASDLKVWKVQSHGSARLRAVVRTRLERGHQLAWAAARAATHEGHPGPSLNGAVTAWPSTPGEVDLAPGALDARPPVPPRGRVVTAGRGPGGEESAPRPDVNWRATLVLAVVVAGLVLLGSRDVFGQGFPLVGQMPSTTGGVSGWWHAWWSGGGPGGLTNPGPSVPAMFLLGTLGALAGGSAPLALHYLVIGCLLAGPLGIYLQTRPFGSYRGRVAATILYAALPLPYDALAQGHLSGLVALAAFPWLLGQLCHLSGQVPYAGTASRSWARYLALGLLLAAASSLAPVLLALVLLVGAALAAGSLLAGQPRGALSLLGGALVTVVVACAALLPWSAHLLGSWSALMGAPGPVSGLSVSQLLRFHTGPYGGGVLAWAIVVAAAGSLFIGRSWRLAWSVRLWAVALACLGLAWAGARGWLTITGLEVLLAPAGTALALATALGAASVESDLSGYRFGWRQLVPFLGVLAVLAAALPLVSWSLDGSWDLPTSGAETAFAFPAPVPGGDYRVLWAGPAAALPLAPQGRVGALAFAASGDGLPPAAQQWAPASRGAAPLVARDLRWALAGATSGLGRLLRPLAVRYLVVPVASLAPGGTVTGAGPTAAEHLVGAVAHQLDLVPLAGQPGYQVFENVDWAPLFFLDRGDLPAAAPAPALLTRPTGAEHPLLVGPDGRATEHLAAGPRHRVVYAAVPSGSWTASWDGRRLAERVALGWGSKWRLPAGASAGELSLAPSGEGGRRLADVLMLLLWALGVGVSLRALRAHWRAQLATASLELGRPSAEVHEIDWGDALEGENLG